MRQRIGIVGIGLMGHGIARNVAKHGHPLAVLDHPGNQPLDELRSMGAEVRATPAALAADRDVVILCVTGTPEVEAVLTGPDGEKLAKRRGSPALAQRREGGEDGRMLAAQLRLQQLGIGT